MTDDATARRIASEWSGGMFSDLYAFVSTGAIREALKYETGSLLLNSDVNVHGEQAIDELTDLHVYVLEHETRGPQPGWSQLWPT